MHKNISLFIYLFISGNILVFCFHYHYKEGKNTNNNQHFYCCYLIWEKLISELLEKSLFYYFQCKLTVGQNPNALTNKQIHIFVSSDAFNSRYN